MYETDDPDLRQPTPAVDPQVNATLSDIKDDEVSHILSPFNINS